MNIVAFFTSDGTPATGLSPTIRIRNVATGALVVTDASMTETGDGFYKYDFTAYDSTVDYAIRCDGTASLPEAERYTYAGNESYFDDIQDATWSAQLSGYIGKGTAGATQQCQLYGEHVVIDVAGGEAGTSWPIGTHRYPVNNLSDGLAITTARKLDTFFLHGPLTIGATDSINGYSFRGHDGWGPAITFTAGCSANETSYSYMALDGEVTSGDVMLVEACTIGELLNFSGIMNVVQFSQGAEISIATWANIIEGSAGGEPTNEPEISLNSAMVTITKYTGNLKLTNKTGANRTTVELAGGNLIIDSTCVAGTIQLLGHGFLEADNSGVGCTVDLEGFLSRETIADSTWDEPRSGHVIAGTFGRSAQIGHDGLAQAGAARSLTLASAASSVNDYYIDDIILITGGQGAGQARRIKSYAGGTRIASLHTAWSTIPNNTSYYIILPGGKSAAADTPQTAIVTTIATLASQTEFTLTEGAPDDNAYNEFRCVISDAANTYQMCLGYISDYTGSTRTVFLREDPGIFTYGVGDQVMILLDATNEEIIADAVWDEATVGHTTPGTYGRELATKADILASSYTESTVATSGSIIFGTADAGTYVETQLRDNNYWEIGETAAGGGGLTAQLVFNLPSADHRAGVLNVFGHYIGTPVATHFIDLYAYNYEASAWEILQPGFMPGGNATDLTFSHEYYERNIDRDNNNEVKFRLIHNPTTYNALHDLFIDFAEVTSIDITTAQDIATAVWSKTLSGGYTAEQYLYYNNEYLKRALGLMHENIYIDNPSYDVNSNLVSARVRIYSDSASVGTTNNVIGTYQISSNTTGQGPGKFNNWRQVKV